MPEAERNSRPVRDDSLLQRVTFTIALDRLLSPEEQDHLGGL